jgi:signal transduction histidine kinase
VKDNTNKLNKLLDSLFLISRFGDGIIQFEKRKSNISELTSSISRDLVMSSRKEINFVQNIDTKIVKAIEISTFTILLENLLTNAFKFSHE